MAGEDASVAPPGSPETSGSSASRGSGDSPTTTAGAPTEPVAPLPGAGEPVPPFPGPDVVVGSFRASLVWPALTTACSVVAFFFYSLIFGPIGIICGLIGFSRGERFSRTALAFAVACMLAGLLFHALTHNHHSLTTGNYYFD